MIMKDLFHVNGYGLASMALFKPTHSAKQIVGRAKAGKRLPMLTVKEWTALPPATKALYNKPTTLAKGRAQQARYVKAYKKLSAKPPTPSIRRKK